MRLLAALLTLCLVLPVHAGSLGTHGNVWSIQEPDMIEFVRSRIRRMYADGSMDRLIEKWRGDTLNALESPRPVPGINTAIRNRTWSYDPTIVADAPIRDHTGRILVMPGTRVNPLDYVPLRRQYVFIDGTDERQVRWARARQDANPAVEIVLTAGRPLDLSRKWKRQVWFDQGGRIASRVGIKAVPAAFRQMGNALEVREIAAF